MLDYTTIMIARMDHEELSRRGTPDYSLGPERISLLRRARSELGGILIAVGERLKTPSAPKAVPATIET